MSQFTVKSIHPRAVEMITQAIRPLLYKGCKIESLQLYVCYQSEVAQHETIDTAFGKLRVRASYYIPKGFSYIREDPGSRFSWVTLKQSKEKKAI
ncbi:hypothetical protein [Paenibacillus sp. FSL H3-0310]|uniref:hypothetical protein n=1 Tax=Paenibacillus sp. FSL H3-0310 TaxID=2921429 RepID=UPI0030F5DB80